MCQTWVFPSLTRLETLWLRCQHPRNSTQASPQAWAPSDLHPLLGQGVLLTAVASQRPDCLLFSKKPSTALLSGLGFRKTKQARICLASHLSFGPETEISPETRRHRRSCYLCEMGGEWEGRGGKESKLVSQWVTLSHKHCRQVKRR